MKSKNAAPSFLVPRFIGRSEADMIAKGHSEQLDIFRENLTRRNLVQVLGMLSLTDQRHLDQPTAAKIADVAEAMGYERSKDNIFAPWLYQEIEDTGMLLRRNSFPVFFREPAGRTKDGKLKYKEVIVDMSILQDFGFQYEDEDGNPIDLEDIPSKGLVRIEAVKGKTLKEPLFALPMTDSEGKFIRNKDGSIRRRMANGVTWTLSSRFVKLTLQSETNWIFKHDAVKILRRHLDHPAAFTLMLRTLFWIHDGLIEMSHDTLVQHLNIRSKDSKQVQKAIDDAFQAAQDEGVIDKWTVREPKYYKPTPKTGKPRRVGKVYQWQRAARWKVGQGVAEISDSQAAQNAGNAENMKS